MKRLVEGTAQRVRCSQCELAFPTFVFSGDTDIISDGLAAATEPATGALALGVLSASERNEDPAVGQRLFAERASRETGRRAVAVEVIRYEPPPQAAAQTFQAFLKHYQASRVVYACPACGADATVETRLEPEAFDAAGELILLDNLTL